MQSLKAEIAQIASKIRRNLRNPVLVRLSPVLRNLRSNHSDSEVKIVSPVE